MIGLGLAGGAGLLGEHRALALQRRRIDRVDVERLGPGGGDVHADLVAERLQRGQLASCLRRATSTPILPRPGLTAACT